MIHLLPGNWPGRTAGLAVPGVGWGCGGKLWWRRVGGVVRKGFGKLFIPKFLVTQLIDLIKISDLNIIIEKSKWTLNKYGIN